MSDDTIEQPPDDQSDLERRLTGATDSLPHGWSRLDPPFTFHNRYGSGTAYFYGPAGAGPPTMMRDGLPHIVVYFYATGTAASASRRKRAHRTTVHRLRTHDVVIDAPTTVDQAQFERFASAVIDHRA